MRRGIIIAGSLALAAIVAVEAGQFVPYQEPRVAASFAAFDPSTVSGRDVEVRLYRGLGGRVWGCGVDCIADDAARTCGVHVTVASHWFGDTVPKAKRVAIVGASLGANKAIRVATDLAPRKVDLLLTIDPTPWVGPKPSNVVDHINWHNTWPVGFGGGTPYNTIPTANIGVRMEHVTLINSDRVRQRAVREICKLVQGS